MDTFSEQTNNLPKRGLSHKDIRLFMPKTFKTHPNLFRVDENRKLIQSYLLSGGTDCLLENMKGNDPKLKGAEVNAHMLLFLEGCDFTKENPFDFPDLAGFFTKHRDLLEGCKRSTVRFYHKRIPCSCLDKIYAEVKSLPKTGCCAHCGQRVEYKALKDCDRCKAAQYCSEECQLSDWSRHKDFCDRYCRGAGGTLSLDKPAEHGAAPALSEAEVPGFGSTAQPMMEGSAA